MHCLTERRAGCTCGGVVAVKAHVQHIKVMRLLAFPPVGCLCEARTDRGAVLSIQFCADKKQLINHSQQPGWLEEVRYAERKLILPLFWVMVKDQAGQKTGH